MQQVRNQALNAKVMLMGYPRLLKHGGQCVPGIGTAESPWLNEMADLPVVRGWNTEVARRARVITSFTRHLDRIAHDEPTRDAT